MENRASVSQGSEIPPLLAVTGVSKSFVGVNVLRNVNLTLRAGEVLTLVGENGAGKSTLIKILSGAIQPDTGEIRMNGQPVSIATPADAERHGIVTVYQEFNLFPDLSVAENLLFQRYPRSGGIINWRLIRKEAATVLERLGVHLPVETPVSRLSIAEKQMLEIAKALDRNARVMILDEPTAVLGGDDVNRLIDLVRSLRERGLGIIFVSHRLNELFALADSYVVLKDGEQVDSGPMSMTTPDQLVARMVGRELSSTRSAPPGPGPKRELLRVEGLSRGSALKNISFSLCEGEIVGLAGLRGAGRTEVARAIFGADPIDCGRVFVRGRERRIDSPNTAAVEGIGLVPEDRGAQGLFKNLSALQNVAIAKIACSPPAWLSPGRERTVAASYVQQLQIKLPHLDVQVDRLSGGNQQKIVLSKWLEAGVSVLLLDEPTRGIDVGSKAQIYEVVRSLCARGTGVLFISSELPELLAVCTRILVMHSGEIVADIDREHATEEGIMKYAVGGASA